MNYKIVSQKKIAVLTISGNIGKDDKDSLMNCSKELLEDDSESVVLYFKNVTSIESIILRELTLLQHEVRQKKRLKVVGLNLQLKTFLTEKGVIRSSEVGANFNEVIFTLNKMP